ncbi:MAG: Na(+)-translocating NADH-quinone reductase subunit A, partial [Saprospiraceae bacterium]|nr:Na(+)-translocating NADH-quinone reductase subunit A [Saprospiraceae bacterium]
VLAGQQILFDKKRPRIKYVSPVSGEVAAINRGDKRSITEVVIIPDREQKFKDFGNLDLASSSRDELVHFLLETGAWPSIRQRPYDLVADPSSTPANIFISTFDSAPLAPQYDFVIAGHEAEWNKGVEVLSHLTDGKVHIGLDANGKGAPSSIFYNTLFAEKHWFSGPHPSGNVGVQMHHIHPVSSKDVAWVLGVQDVVLIGRLFTEKRYNAERIVALTGQGVKDQRYVRTTLGAKISDLLQGQELTDAQRIISGDVLSGEKKSVGGYLNYYDDHLTVIAEGKEYELFGWLLPLKMRPSISPTYPNFLFPDVKYSVNTNAHGEKRAFVVTGQYEKMLPMQIYPQHLMKAILTNDYEKMEGLGIHELSEEDLALCEFACTSKQPLQQILRQGLEMMREQG